MASGHRLVGEPLAFDLSDTPDPPVSHADTDAVAGDLPELPRGAFHHLQTASVRPALSVTSSVWAGGKADVVADADVGGEARHAAVGQLLVAEGDRCCRPAAGSSRSASEKPVPTENVVPSASSTSSAPSRPLCRPAPAWCSSTRASASWKLFTFSSVVERPDLVARAGLARASAPRRPAPRRGPAPRAGGRAPCRRRARAPAKYGGCRRSTQVARGSARRSSNGAVDAPGRRRRR